jgi:hypothetical protein
MSDVASAVSDAPEGCPLGAAEGNVRVGSWASLAVESPRSVVATVVVPSAVVPSVLAVDAAVYVGDGVDEEVETPTVVSTSTPGAAELVVVGGSDWEAEGTPENATLVFSEDANGAVPASLAQAFTKYSKVNRDGRRRQRIFRWMFVSRT